jgi:O-antigen/teichoic acid export membrane protein
MTPNIYIAKYLSLNDVAVFNVAYKYVSIPLVLLTAVLPVFWPRFTLAWQRNELGWLRNRLLLIISATAGLSLLFLIISFGYGQQLIYIWTKKNILVSKELLLMFCVWLMIQGIVYWLSTFLHSISDFKFELLFYFITSTVSVTMINLLVTPLGLRGVSISMIAGMFIGSLIPMARRTIRKLTREQK